MSLSGKTAIITGSSRGIGRAIALRLAREGINVVIAAKTDSPHPKLPGTIHSVAEEVRALGVEAMAVRLDVRDDARIARTVEQVQERFGRIDILVNNAGAIKLATTEHIEVKRIDLMHAVNVRGALLCSKFCAPHLRQAGGGHILNMSPPIVLDPKWFKDYTAYTISKFAMSMTSIGLAAELRSANVAVNSLWPKTTIATAAIEFNPELAPLASCRTPDIVADAAYEILVTEPSRLSGRLLIDEDFLRERGYADFDKYAVQKSAGLTPDLYIDHV